MNKHILFICLLLVYHSSICQTIEKESSIISFLNQKTHHIVKDSGYVVIKFNIDSSFNYMEFLDKLNHYYSNRFLDSMQMVLFTWKGKLYSGNNYKTIKLGSK